MNPDPFHDKSRDEIANDFFMTLYTGGIHGGLEALGAIADEDEQELYYMAVIEAMAMGFIYGSVQFLNYVQGPKYAITFGAAHEGLGVVRSIAMRGVAPFASAGAVGYGVGAVVGTAIMAPFGYAKESIRIYSSPKRFIKEALLGLGSNFQLVAQHYLGKLI